MDTKDGCINTTLKLYFTDKIFNLLIYVYSRRYIWLL
jgi:hypothetical protein